jgi:Holliday junction resolvase RusA-like endonuclease
MKDTRSNAMDEVLAAAAECAVTFRIDSVPVAQPRARATAIGGKARMYEAKKSHPIHVFKAAVQMAWAAEHLQPFIGPLYVELTFVFPRTKKLKTGGRVPYARKPDLDNTLKAPLDALNGFAWGDDSQVCDARIRKYYAASGEAPHCTMTIQKL